MILWLPLLLACNHADDTAQGDDTSADTPEDTGEVEASCHGTPAAADRERVVVISHPFTAGGQPASDWEALTLSATGALSATGQHFAMGSAFMGQVVFTPDGELGFAVQDDGTVGVLRIDAGQVEVLDAGWSGVYAGQVVVDPSGDRLWVLNTGWREHGGGVYEVPLSCEGVLGEPRLVVAGKQPMGMTLLPGRSDQAFLGARDLGSSAEGDRGHLLDLGGGDVVAGAPAFPDDDAIMAATAVTSDGLYGLISDNSSFSGVPNRVGVVSLGDDAVTAHALLSEVKDAVAMVSSPFDNTVLVASGFEDALLTLSEHGGAWQNDGELSYRGGGPQLPSGMVMIERGSLEGLVLVAENVAVRSVQFEVGGATDLGAWGLGSGIDKVVGAVGVQP
ncbi:MAG: hypothetical protein JXX28_06120 [Deltaproteobacteria bacterium]|nr:hypothetical protein [Deltaproteobacteria bacterium]